MCSSDLTLAQRGAKLFNDLACSSCHLDSGQGRGPSLKDIVGTTVEFQDGSNAVVDEAYLRESILTSQAKIVKGFQPLMPTFQGLISEENLVALIEHVKSLSPKATTAAAPTQPQPASQTGGSPVNELKQIDHVFVTHSHLDHVACIPFLVDTVGGMRRAPITVRAERIDTACSPESPPNTTPTRRGGTAMAADERRQTYQPLRKRPGPRTTPKWIRDAAGLRELLAANADLPARVRKASERYQRLLRLDGQLAAVRREAGAVVVERVEAVAGCGLSLSAAARRFICAV